VWPAYAGGTDDLNDWMRRHRHNTADVANLGGGADLRVATLETDTAAGAYESTDRLPLWEALVRAVFLGWSG